MKDANVRRASTFHKRLFRATGGRIGKRLVDNDMLLLTTTGRSSGEDHTVPLLYLRDVARLVVIASYGGRDFYPDWYLNLVDNPAVEVELPGSRATMTARTADATERAEWWSRAVEAYDGYSEYQVRTEREIPVVFLDPRD